MCVCVCVCVCVRAHEATRLGTQNRRRRQVAYLVPDDGTKIEVL